MVGVGNGVSSSMVIPTIENRMKQYITNFRPLFYDLSLTIYVVIAIGLCSKNVLHLLGLLVLLCPMRVLTCKIAY